MAEAIKSPQSSICGPNGFEVREGPWNPPTAISQDVREDAKREFYRINYTLDPAEEKIVRWWLMALGPLVASAMNADDARFKVNTFCGVLGGNYPAKCAVDQGSLLAAAKHFKFWPTFSELSSFWESREGKTKEIVRRLDSLARDVSSDFDQSQPISTEERQAMGVKLGDLAKAIADPEKLAELAKAVVIRGSQTE